MNDKVTAMKTKAKMFRRTTFTLPNDKTTSSMEVYVAAWREIGTIIGEATNSKLFAFDPDFGFVRKNGGNSFSIPVDIAVRLAAAIKKSK